MGRYTGKQTTEISFPLGGIGTGSIGFGGDGRLIDWEIANRPAKGTRNGYTFFAIKAEQDGKVLDARMLHGDMQKEYIGHFCNLPFLGFGYGPNSETMASFPHFKNTEFVGEMPIAELLLKDMHFPGMVNMTAFNPLIPLQDLDSSLPAAFFSVLVQNTTDKPITYTIAFAVQNPFAAQTVNRSKTDETATYLELTQQVVTADDPAYGELCAGTHAPAKVQEYWFRGSWFDGASMFWNNFITPGDLPSRHYPDGGEGVAGTITSSFTIAPGEKKETQFVLAWYYPTVENTWHRDDNAPNADYTWKNYYATQFDSAAHVASYCLKNWNRLYEGSQAFRKALFSSTLPEAVIEAAAANLAVLKSPVTLRLPDGSFYGWEGTMEQQGSCEGTCTHVWNYAYALPFLFPNLQRSIRDLEYTYSMWDNGRVSFRLQLPLGRKPDNFHPCVDGQMGALLQIYRDWKISGNDAWLKNLWPRMKKALAFTWDKSNKYAWDSNRDGVLEGRQHHTLDMELYGPNAWLEGFYIAALEAMAQMAEYLGEPDTADDYRNLEKKGEAYLEKTLFNGQYYQQEIDLRDKTLLTPYEGVSKTYWNEETKQIKYQMGAGCALDQMCAQWHADIIGLGDIFDPAHKRTALEYMFAHNFKPSVREYANPCRVYAFNDEGGAILCEYADDVEKPDIPVPYCEECWTGLEYELAGLLYREGMCDQGLQVVEAVRARYDGEKRNPYSELECGSNYARSMASFALLPIISGFTFDLPHQTIGFDPVIKQQTFQCLWSLEPAYGTVTISTHETSIYLIAGSLQIRQLRLPYIGHLQSVIIDGILLPDATYNDGCVTFPIQTIQKNIKLVYSK